MCESLRDLAANTMHSFLVPTCLANQNTDNCTGVRCNVFTLGGVYYIEGVVLPCDNAVELIVENSNLDPIFTTVFNESGHRPLVIDGYMIEVNSTIIAQEYSLQVAVSDVHI